MLAELTPLRENAAKDSAKLQRLVIEMEGLDREFLRQKERALELSEFIQSTKSQLVRENEILTDLKDLLAKQGDNEFNIQKKYHFKGLFPNRFFPSVPFKLQTE